MTAQEGDKLLYEGTTYIIASEPPLSLAEPDIYEVRFTPGRTSCWRGYMAEWALKDDKLYLLGVEGSALVTDLVSYTEEKLRLAKLLRQGEITPEQNEKMLKEIKESLTAERDIDLKFLFNTTEPVFAGWVSGIIRVPMGKMLRYVHMGYASVYRKDMFLSFSSGILKETRVVRNRRRRN
jgi:hypothetical protein